MTRLARTLTNDVAREGPADAAPLTNTVTAMQQAADCTEIVYMHALTSVK